MTPNIKALRSLCNILQLVERGHHGVCRAQRLEAENCGIETLKCRAFNPNKTNCKHNKTFRLVPIATAPVKLSIAQKFCVIDFSGGPLNDKQPGV